MGVSIKYTYGHELEVLMKTKKFIAGSLVAAIILTLSGCHSKSQSSNNNSEASAEYEDVYQEVDLEISELIKTSDFQDGNHQERKETIDKLLSDLVSEGSIKDNSVKFSDDESLITFEYSNGAFGGVMLEDFDDGIEGINQNYVEKYNSDMTVKAFADEIQWGNVTHPYKESDLDAIIMYGLGYDRILDGLKRNKKEWSDVGLETDLDDYCTLADFRSKLSNNDLIVIREHGLFDYNTPMICLDNIDNDVNLLDAAALPLAALYKEDLSDLYNRRVASLTGTDGNRKFGVFPKFIEHYYGKGNKLENSIVWLGCCYGYKNDDLVSAFYNSGAKCVIGSTDSVNINYGFLMCDAFVYQLLYGNTVSDSLDYSKQIWGKDDNEFLRLYSNSGTTDIAEFKIYNNYGKDSTLVTLTDEASKFLENKESEEVLPIIKQVLNDENNWTETINTQDETYSLYNLSSASGDDYIWFQDMDMDGELEFVTMSKYMKGTDIGTFRMFNIYSFDGNELLFRCAENTVVSESGTIYAGTKEFESDTFNYSLWIDKKGQYHYLTGGTCGNVVLGQLYELDMTRIVTHEKPIITIYDENTSKKGCNIRYTADEYGVGYSFDSVLYEEGVGFYDKFFENLTPCDTTIKKIKLSEYKAMSNDDKIQALTDSYYAWSYKQNGTMMQPLKDVVEAIRNIPELTVTSNVYKENYKSIITALSFNDSINTIEYTLYDMNVDGIPELVIKTGSCEADSKLSFYTYKENIGVIPIDNNFSGFHTAFYVDKESNSFCTHWGHMGVGGIAWYSFDGNSISETKRQDNIEYATPNATFENYDEAYAPYGDFESLDTAYCFKSWDQGWMTAKNENSVIGIDYSIIDNY